MYIVLFPDAVFVFTTANPRPPVAAAATLPPIWLVTVISGVLLKGSPVAAKYRLVKPERGTTIKLLSFCGLNPIGVQSLTVMFVAPLTINLISFVPLFLVSTAHPKLEILPTLVMRVGQLVELDQTKRATALLAVAPNLPWIIALLPMAFQALFAASNDPHTSKVMIIAPESAALVVVVIEGKAAIVLSVADPLVTRATLREPL